MANKTVTRLHDLIGVLNSLYPPYLAEDWDNVGLQVGDLKQQIVKVAIALEPGTAVVAAAIEQGCQALITHHPLIFKPLKKITPGDETGKIIYSAISRQLSIVSIHTNLDRAGDGLNDWLAQLLGIEENTPLLTAPAGDLLKMVVFVPADSVDKVAEAVFSAGGGCVGGYSECSFRSNGVATFRPSPGCKPHIGDIGTTAHAEETRLEIIVPRSQLSKIIKRVVKVHPYEEVAYDLLPLENCRSDIGLGRIGSLSAAQTLNDFASRCKARLACQHVRIVAANDKPIKKVAVCGGSGASLIHEAARRGADVLVTGDVKYHEALTAQALGLNIIDAGHFATEHLMAEALVKKLTLESQQRAWPVEYIAVTGETDPFELI